MKESQFNELTTDLVIRRLSSLPRDHYSIAGLKNAACIDEHLLSWQTDMTLVNWGRVQIALAPQPRDNETFSFETTADGVRRESIQ